MQDYAPVSTLLAAKTHLSISQCPISSIDIEEYKAYVNGLNYLKIIGTVLYITQTCPDIQYAIEVLAQFGSNPGKPHLEALNIKAVEVP